MDATFEFGQRRPAAADTDGPAWSDSPVPAPGPLVWTHPRARARRNGRAGRVDRLAVGLLAAAIAVGAWAILADGSPTPAGSAAMADAGSSVPTSPALEDEFGIRLTGAYLTADGGMVELTYQVLDADKAVAVHLEENGPVIVADGAVFEAPGLAGHGHGKQGVAAGRSTFVLLANIGGALRAGDTVAVRVGDVVLDGVRLG
ncbi:MAG: hypothetical protein NTZ21_10630 [Actinobacteria bacterium]|nr:hypothetical protein [Actinomycetota bacterium]